MHVNQTYCGDIFSIYTNINSLCCIPKTNTMLHANYTVKKRNVYTTISESCLPFLSCIWVLVDRDRNSVGAQSLKSRFTEGKEKPLFSAISEIPDSLFLVACLQNRRCFLPEKPLEAIISAPVGMSLEKEMATYSSILAWRIPWTEEPGGLLSMVSYRVGHG